MSIWISELESLYLRTSPEVKTPYVSQKPYAATRSAERASSARRKNQRSISAKQSAMQVPGNSFLLFLIAGFNRCTGPNTFSTSPESVCSCGSGEVCKFSSNCEIKKIHPSYTVFYHPSTAEKEEEDKEEEVTKVKVLTTKKGKS